MNTIVHHQRLIEDLNIVVSWLVIFILLLEWQQQVELNYMPWDITHPMFPLQ